MRNRLIPILAASIGLHSILIAVAWLMPPAPVRHPPATRIAISFEAPDAPDTPAVAGRSDLLEPPPEPRLRPLTPPPMPPPTEPRQMHDPPPLPGSPPDAAPSTPQALASSMVPAALTPAGADLRSLPRIDEAMLIADATDPAAAPAVYVDAPPAPHTGNTPPGYPIEARRMGWQGTAVLSVDVSADGTVRDAGVTESSGHSVLDEEALRTVRQWRFDPARIGDSPAACRVTIPIRFVISR